MASIVDRAHLQRRVDSLNVLIRSHAGEIEVVDVSADGVVALRYTGMCAGCDYRPVTTAGTVEPALLDVPGVTGVTILGARVSEEAQERIAATLEGSGARERAVRLVHRMESERQEEGSQ
ncbi:MAG: Fe-S biosis protein NfuA [Ramlibacter sp.]|nr:Fe-S biosis protein NfuA [Ramlibacter sp.]